LKRTFLTIIFLAAVLLLSLTAAAQNKKPKKAFIYPRAKSYGLSIAVLHRKAAWRAARVLPTFDFVSELRSLNFRELK
jgi:hypothetical protein